MFFFCCCCFKRSFSFIDCSHWEQKKYLSAGWWPVMLGAVATTTRAVNTLRELWLLLPYFITSCNITPVYDDRMASCAITHFSFAYIENYIVPGNAINIHFRKSNINQLGNVTEKTPFTVLGSAPEGPAPDWEIGFKRHYLSVLSLISMTDLVPLLSTGLFLLI